MEVDARRVMDNNFTVVSAKKRCKFVSNDERKV
jgi:hypothetical protein